MATKNYTKIRKLGQGSFGSVFLVRDNKEGVLFVMKEVDLTSLGVKGKDEAMKEVSVLGQMRHPCIISYRDFFEQEPAEEWASKKKLLYIIMEYADGADMSARIQKQKGRPFTEQQILDWLVQICLALKHIHDRKILHRDIKSENIFLTHDNLVKVGDFGIAKSLAHTFAQAHTRIGTPYYLSPEICLNKPYNSKSDMWSLGVVLYELLTLRHPFNASSIEGLLDKIVRSKPAPISKMYSKEIRQVCDNLLQKDPRLRPSAAKLLQLPFIQKNIKRFLTAGQLQEEFSHTIIHTKADDESPSIEESKGSGLPRDTSSPRLNRAPSVAQTPGMHRAPSVAQGGQGPAGPRPPPSAVASRPPPSAQPEGSKVPPVRSPMGPAPRVGQPGPPSQLSPNNRGNGEAVAVGGMPWRDPVTGRGQDSSVAQQQLQNIHREQKLKEAGMSRLKMNYFKDRKEKENAKRPPQHSYQPGNMGGGPQQGYHNGPVANPAAHYQPSSYQQGHPPRSGKPALSEAGRAIFRAMA